MSEFTRPGDVFLADCPARLAVDVIADKWSVVVVFALGRGPRRHRELQQLIGGISPKMLTQTLRKLRGYGLVTRHAFAEVPPRVEYDLTPLGHTLLEPISMLSHWSQEHGAAVVAAYEEATASQDQVE